MYDLFFLGNQMDEERKRRIREDSCFNDECREEFFFFGLALAGIMRSRFPEDGNFDFSL
jgi:hypothetical protein